MGKMRMMWGWEGKKRTMRGWGKKKMKMKMGKRRKEAGEGSKTRVRPSTAIRHLWSVPFPVRLLVARGGGSKRTEAYLRSG